MKRMLKQIALMLILAIIPALKSETFGQALSRIDSLEKTYSALVYPAEKAAALIELQKKIVFYTAARKLSKAARSENRLLSHGGISFTDGMINNIISGLQELHRKFSHEWNDSKPTKPKRRLVCLPRLF